MAEDERRMEIVFDEVRMDGDGGGATKKKKKAAAPEPINTDPTPPPPVPNPTLPVATTVPTTTAVPEDISNKPLVDQVLYRLTEGIPRYELKAMMREADECEKNLEQEIRMLEEALKRESGKEVTTEKPSNESAAATAAKAKLTSMSKEDLDKQVNTLMENPFTPLDRCFTLSALLGRLRDDLAIPSNRKPSPAVLAASAGNTSKKKKANSNPAPTYPQLVAMADNPNYTRVHPDPPTQLLNVWRKIASHRTAMVFRRPGMCDE